MSDVIWYIFFIGIFVLLLVVILLIVLDWRKDRKAAINGTKEPQQPVVIYIGKDGKVSTDSDKVLIKQEEVVEEVINDKMCNANLEDKRLNVEELCKRWNISKGTLANWEKDGRIAPLPLGGRRKIYSMGDVLNAESEGLIKRVS